MPYFSNPGFVTKSCAMVFDTIQERDLHAKTLKHFKCESCVIDFETYTEWKDHRNFDKTCKALTCPSCGKNFQNESPKSRSFKGHVTACQNLRNFVCDICAQSFNFAHHLKKHRLVHTELQEQKRLLSSLSQVSKSVI